jgi:hypothetical protein
LGGSSKKLAMDRMTMRFKPTNSNTTIVLIGHFNPLIFMPSWFAKNGIIGEEEGAKADIEIAHKEVVKFSLDWLTLVVEQSRFIAEIEQPPEVRLYDFVLKTFGEYLTHTPIRAMGINKKIEFNLDSVDQRDQLGFALAPPDAWGGWAEKIKKKGERARGGMVSLSMRQSLTDDGRPNGYIQTKVDPSPSSDRGVVVLVNDHYELGVNQAPEGCREIIELLHKNFESSIKRSEWIVDQLMSAVK